MVDLYRIVLFDPRNRRGTRTRYLHRRPPSARSLRVRPQVAACVLGTYWSGIVQLNVVRVPLGDELVAIILALEEEIDPELNDQIGYEPWHAPVYDPVEWAAFMGDP